MYKLLNKWFGWDFIAVKYGSNYSIRKVQYSSSGLYVVVFGDLIFLSDTSKDIKPLTFQLEELNKKG